MNLKRLILLVVIFASASAFGQSRKADQDVVLVDSITFKQVSKNEVPGVGGPLLRGEISVLVKQIAAKKGALKDWVRNVEVEILAGFEDKANKGWLLLDSRAKIFAAERNKKTPIVFYIPWESYSIYRINREPDFYKISLFVDGQEIAIDESNVKQRVSKNIKSMKELEAFEKAVSSQSSKNKGVLKPLNECATNVQEYEYNNSRASVPTYLDAK